jgi:hypothetical protein
MGEFRVTCILNMQKLVVQYEEHYNMFRILLKSFFLWFLFELHHKSIHAPS